MSDWTLVLDIDATGAPLLGTVADLAHKVSLGADIKVRYQDDPATWWTRECSSVVTYARTRVTAIAEGIDTADSQGIAYPYAPDKNPRKRYYFFASSGDFMSSDTFGEVDDWPMDPNPPRQIRMQWFARGWYAPVLSRLPI